MNITLARHAYLPEATLGWMFVGDLRIATLEEPWRPDPDGPGGQRREAALLESCIPDGRYQVVPHDSVKHPGVWALVNPMVGVYRWPGDIPPSQKWGRSAILIHAGNTTEAILGCIAVGLSHSFVANKPFISNSQAALSNLRTALGRAEHTMTIRPIAGTAEIAA